MTDYKGYFSEKEKLAHRYSREKKHGRRWVVLCEDIQRQQACVTNIII